MHVVVFCVLNAITRTLANSEDYLDKQAESAASEAVDNVLKMASGLMSNRMGKNGKGDLQISSENVHHFLMQFVLGGKRASTGKSIMTKNGNNQELAGISAF